MVDPIGLVSLGLDGAGQLLKVKKRARRRTAALVQLSTQLDDAHKLLVGEGYSTEDAAIYDTVLLLPMDAALALLERERRRTRLSASFGKYIRASDDIEEAERLAQILKDAPSEIQARLVARDARIMRIDIEFIRAHHELASHTPSANANHPVALMISISSIVFQTFGEAGVTL